MVTKSPNVPAPGHGTFPMVLLEPSRTFVRRLFVALFSNQPVGMCPLPSAGIQVTPMWVCVDNMAEEPLSGGFPSLLSPSTHPLVSKHKVTQSDVGALGEGTPNATTAGTLAGSVASRVLAVSRSRMRRAGRACQWGHRACTSLRDALGPDSPGPETTGSFLGRIRTLRGRLSVRKETDGDPCTSCPLLGPSGRVRTQATAGGEPPYRTTPPHHMTSPLLLEGTDFPVSGTDPAS